MTSQIYEPAAQGLKYAPPLPVTGERYLPRDMAGNIELEHLHRYAIACELAHGKVVLDIASGEGYGSNLLAQAAQFVIGVDISREAIAHAKHLYRRDNLDFRHGNCAAIPVADHSIDLAVSFETIEHHDQHEEMIAELKRVLKPDGMLIISSPDKLHYSDIPGYKNEFHVKELYFDEFRALLAAHFRHLKFQGQKVHYGSLVLPIDTYLGDFQTFAGTPEAVTNAKGIVHPVFFIALASDAELPSTSSSIFDGTAAFAGLLEQYTTRLGETQNQLDQATQKLNITLNSIYWRITYPLRLLCKGVKKFAGI
jgi:2-polyprenyl-3-methyl-5-hydroxy-6-metoxy-1,4-benzoquinol methylase